MEPPNIRYIQMEPIKIESQSPSTVGNFSMLSEDILQSVQRILNNINYNRRSERNRLKIYSLFYVDPLSAKTGVWDFVIIMAIYLLEIQISLTLGFGPQFWANQLNNKFYTILYCSLLVLLAVDVIINFHKGYYAFGRGKVIDQPKLIIKHYLKIYFAIDIVILGTLVIPLIKSGYFLNILQLAPAILLYFKKFKNQNEIIGMLQYHKKFRVFFIILMLALDVLLIGHIGACIFVGIDLILWRQQYYGNNAQYYWLSNNDMYSINLIDGPWVVQYIYAQSFSTGTLSTIAPGPFPKNPIEVLYSNLVMIFFMFLASYAAQVLVSILMSEDQIRTFHQDNIQKFDKFLKLKGVTETISQRIHNFFQLVWETEVKMNVEEEREVLQKLPVSLKQQLIIQMEFAHKLKFLQNFSNSELIIRLISLKVETSIIDNGTTLFKARTPPMDKDQIYLYHFKDGIAKFYVQKNEEEVLLALSNVQRTVGQFQFLTGLAYSYSCKSADLCIISKISYKQLIQIIQENDMIVKNMLTQQQYQVMKYKLLIENQLELISKSCIVCEGKHIQSKCPFLSLDIQIGRKYFQGMKDQSNARQPYSRKNTRCRKQQKIGKRIVAKAYIILIFIVFKNFREELTNIQYGIQQISQFQNYFPQFNL